MIRPELDFAYLKKAVSIDCALRARGIHLRARGRRLFGPCPVHGGDNPTAFTVDVVLQLWFCHTGCQRGGDVVDLVRLMDRCGYAQAAERLTRIAAPATPERPGPVAERAFQPYTRRLQLDPTAPLLRAKGIQPDTAAAFEAGAWHGPGFLEGCVGVRLHDPDGNALGYAGRHLLADKVAQFGKWRFPTGLPKRDLLYNYHRVRALAPRGLVVVEGAWSVMRLAQLGIPAVALLGSSLSDGQKELLGRARVLVVLMDGDHAGRRAAGQLYEAFTPGVIVVVRDLAAGTDPDDLTDEQLRGHSSSLLRCHQPGAALE